MQVEGLTFVFYNLGHELTFTHEFLANEGTAFHHGATTTQFGHERYVENESVAGNNFLTELHVIYFMK